MTQIDNKFEPTNRANHDLMTLSLNKYVTCTHNAQIRQVSILKDASRRRQWDMSILYFKGSQVKFLTFNIFLSLKIVFLLGISSDTDEMPP